MAGKLKARVSIPAISPPAAAEYLFHLDALPPRVTFSKRLEITGWLLHREGKSIHGLRAVVKPSLRRQRIYKARRKRARPGIGVAYPSLPEAAMSGFLLEMDDLPFGRCELELEVKDHQKIWRPIFTTRLQTLPLDFLGRIRLHQVQRLVVGKLSERFDGPSRVSLWESAAPEEIKKRLSQRDTLLVRAAVKKVHLFVTSKSNLFIVEIAELVCAGFHDAGFEATLFVDRIPAEETPNDTIQIVVTPHEFYNLFLSPKLPPAEVQTLTRNVFLLGTEQPDSDWFHSNLAIAPYARAMLDINALGVASYRDCGLRCFHLPLGYHPLLERIRPGEIPNRDIDICVLASITKRREQFLAAHATFFSRHNCHLRLVPLGFAKTKETRSYLSGETRNALLQRAKILLNIHYSKRRYFEWHRILVGLANHCCIITETCEGFAPLVPGKHFVMVEAEELVRACQYYLDHPEEREAIARAGRDLVRRHLTQASNCLRCMEQIMTGNEESLGTDSSVEGRRDRELLHGAGSVGRRSLLWQALEQDLRNLLQPEESAPITNLEADTKTVAAIGERRRGYAERFAQQNEVMRQGAEPWDVSDNERFREITSPAISIIITL